MATATTWTAEAMSQMIQPESALKLKRRVWSMVQAKT
jgi:hypothetical protein